MFNPALHDHPQEANMVGLLVTGYPELDIMLCHVCGLAIGNKLAVIGALHKVTSEQARIDIANELCRHIYEAKDMTAKFGEAIGAITHCRKIRNQYAHAQWASIEGKLGFLRAESHNWKAGAPLKWSFIDGGLLQQQESYFEYTRKCLMWLEHQWDGLGKHLTWPEHMMQPPQKLPDVQCRNPPPEEE